MIARRTADDAGNIVRQVEHSIDRTAQLEGTGWLGDLQLQQRTRGRSRLSICGEGTSGVRTAVPRIDAARAIDIGKRQHR